MTCVSRAPRGSRRLRALLLALAAWLAADHASGRAIARALDEDRRWLRSHPAWRLTTPDPADSLGALAWVQRAERLRRAPVDTVRIRGVVPARGQRSVLALLRDRWLDRGHLDVGVALRDDGDGGRRIVVAPGPRYRVGTIEVGGDRFEGRGRLLAGWLPAPGDVFRPAVYLDAAAAVLEDLAERGFPFPTWVTRDVRPDPATGVVAVEAVLIPGPRAYVGRQMSTLPPGRASRFVVRAAGVGTGDRFRESDLARGVDRLRARDLYARVDAPLVHLTASDDTVGIVWRVAPRRDRNRVAVVLGLGRDADGGSRLSGQVDLDLPDLAGTGRRLAARWEDDGAERSRFGFSYLEPLILGTPLDAELALASEVQESSYTRFRVDSRWRMAVVALWGIEVGVGWDRNTFPTGALQRTSRTRGRVAVLHHRGDRSRSGWEGSLAVETVDRTEARRVEGDGELAVPELSEESGQRLLEADLAGERWLGASISIAGRASFREVVADVRPVPLPEQYRFGGAATLRGYREEEFHGERAAWGGLEVRLGRPQRSRVYTFVDVGYFEFSLDDPTSGAVVTRDGTATGFGLGLLTTAAAGRIDLAVGFPGSMDFDTAKLHAALVGSF